MNTSITKLAYIITAYRDPAHLRRLIDSVNENYCHFFIHIDLKQDVKPFQEELKDYKNVAFCGERFFINWGSFAQVLSQKELLRCVLQSGICFDRIICLSGTDYPIWSNEKILKEFDDNLEKEYIQAINLSKIDNSFQHKRIRLYHFFRDIKIKNYTLKKCFSGSARIFMKLLPLRKKLTTTMDTRTIDVYFGSDYWALTGKCAKYVYEKLCSEHELIKYFESSFVPSEMVVQTIVFNSPFANNAIYTKDEDYKGLYSITPLHYIEYNKEVKTFNEQDYNTLVRSGKMFFRKASTGYSDLLIKKINILREKQSSLK